MQPFITASPNRGAVVSCAIHLPHLHTPRQHHTSRFRETIRLQALLQDLSGLRVLARIIAFLNVLALFPCVHIFEKHGQYFSEDEKSRLTYLRSFLFRFL